MTTPTEQSIRKAFKEAGLEYFEGWRRQYSPASVYLVLALARRIEDDGVPVAVIGKDYSLLWASQDTIKAIVDRTGIGVGSFLYAHPQPDRVKELEAALRKIATVDEMGLAEYTPQAMVEIARAALKGSTDADA